MGAVASAEPDGHTFLVTSAIFTSAPWTSPKLAFDPVKDFTPVIPLANTAHVLVMSPGRGVQTLNDLVTYARAKRGAVNYVTLGPGSVAHLNAERFRLAAKFEATPIPYKGPAEALTDVMTGHKAFSLDVLLGLGLSESGFGFEVEVAAKSLKTRLRVGEVPISYKKRTEGKSKIRLRDGVRCLIYLVELTRTPESV